MENYIKTIDNIYNSIFKKKPLVSGISFYQLSEENQQKYASVLRHLKEIMQYPSGSVYATTICDLAREIRHTQNGIVCDYCGYTYDPREVKIICDYDWNNDKKDRFVVRKACQTCRTFKYLIECSHCHKLAHNYCLYPLVPTFSLNKDDDPDDSLSRYYNENKDAYEIKDKSDYDNPIIRDVLEDFFTIEQIKTLQEHHREWLCVDCLRKLGIGDKYLIPSYENSPLGRKTGRKVAIQSIEYNSNSRRIEENMLRNIRTVLKGIDTYSKSIPISNINTSNIIPTTKAVKMISAHFNKELFYLLDNLYKRVTYNYNRPSIGNYREINSEYLNDLGIIFENNPSSNFRHHDVLIILPIEKIYGNTQTIEAIISNSIYTGKYICPITNKEYWEYCMKNGAIQKYEVTTSIDNLSVEAEDNQLIVSFMYNIETFKIH